MGSELLTLGFTIWAADSRALHTISFPSYLVPWFPLESGPPVGTYERFIRFAKDAKGYRENDDLFLFGYDWRQGIRAAAIQLAHFVENSVRTRHGGQILFVAHSMGCLVVRWAITKRLINPAKVWRVVAAGPPSLGSPRAFASVAEMPKLSAWFDRMHSLSLLARPISAYRTTTSVTRTLMTLRSLLELMPPRAVPILSDGSGQLFSAFDWLGWPEQLTASLALAERTQSELESDPWPTPGPPRHLVAAQKWPTEAGYELDHTDRVGIQSSLPHQPGDETILFDSALQFGFDTPPLVVKSKHDGLLSDTETLNFLGQYL
jgi:hypothetical protein